MLDARFPYGIMCRRPGRYLAGVSASWSLARDVPPSRAAHRRRRPFDVCRSVLNSARAAHLASRLEPADAPELPAVQPRFVFEHAGERGPARVVDRLRHACAGESFHREVFHSHRLVFADDLRGELVVEVPARVLDPCMRPRDFRSFCGGRAKPAARQAPGPRSARTETSAGRCCNAGGRLCR